MVESSLRGRPSFSTFLQSETSAGGDGLTYYDYQRHLRSQKVALLQERRAITHIPGYKKVVLSKSRKVFQTKNRTPTHIYNISGEDQPSDEYSKPEPASSTKELVHQSTSTGSALSLVRMPAQKNVVWKFDDQKGSETDRLPRIAAHHRPIKSATARACPNFESELQPSRPITVVGDHSTGVQTYDLVVKGDNYIISMHIMTLVKLKIIEYCVGTGVLINIISCFPYRYRV